ncbi:MAG TPA: hypothetical protein VGH77_09405 [Streptosporangiaceae bacterium]
MSWLTSSLLHNDPRGMSPDISMTPAPSTWTIAGQATHSRAADQASPLSAISAMIRCSLLPLGTSAIQSQARALGAAHGTTAHGTTTIVHLPAPP